MGPVDLDELTNGFAGEIVSPEAFVDVDVAPGQTQKWTRSYTFDSGA